MVDTLDDSGRSLAELKRRLESITIILDTITHVESEFILHKSAASLSSLLEELLDAAKEATGSEGGTLIQLNQKSNNEVENRHLYKNPEITKESPYKIHLPLLNQSKVVGILSLWRKKPIYDQDTIELLLPLLQVAILIIEGFEIEEKVQAANKAKSSFLAKISHEVKTPLNAIVGISDLLSRTELSSDQEKFLEKLKQSAEHLLELMNNLLDLSSFEIGIVRLDKRSFNLKELVKELFDILNPLAEEKQLTLSLKMQSKEECHGDPLRLKQVLVNLLSNAIKFTDAGTVTLEIEEGSIETHFAIIDTGAGVPDALKRAIFEPFIQGDDSVTRRYGGAGLGLSIASHLIKSMGGEIQLSSSMGYGSRFSFGIVL